MKQNMTNKTFEKLEQEIVIAQKMGHITTIRQLPQKKGIELALSGAVNQQQANSVAKFIEKKYGVRAYFFVKKHHIVVYYDDNK